MPHNAPLSNRAAPAQTTAARWGHEMSGRLIPAPAHPKPTETHKFSERRRWDEIASVLFPTSWPLMDYFDWDANELEWDSWPWGEGPIDQEGS